jgi:hypothetical protein
MTTKEMQNAVINMFGFEHYATVNFFTICEYESKENIAKFYNTCVEIYNNMRNED